MDITLVIKGWYKSCEGVAGTNFSDRGSTFLGIYQLLPKVHEGLVCHSSSTGGDYGKICQVYLGNESREGLQRAERSTPDSSSSEAC